MSKKPNIRFKVELTHRNDPQPVFHRFTGSYTYSELNSVISHLWGQRPKHSILNYIDDEGDPIRVSTDAEWEECIRIHMSSTASVLRLSGKPAPKSKKSRGNKATEESSSSSSDSEAETDKAPVPAQEQDLPPQAAPEAPQAEDLNDVSVVEENFEKTDTTSTAPIIVPELDNLQPVPAPEEEVIAEVQKEEVPAEETPAPPTTEEVKEETKQPAAPQDKDAVPELNTGATAVDLMSLVYNCDAGEELYQGNTAKFSDVVTRTTDPENPSEVHLDIDRSKLFRDTMFKSSELMGKKKTLPTAEHLIKTAMVVFTDNVHLQYKLACILSLQKRLEECLDMLLVAQANGFDEVSKLQNDSDLANVRKHPRFVEIVPSEDAPVIDYHEEVEEEKPAAVPLKQSEKPVQSDNPDVLALMAMFPDMTVDEATCVMVLAKGNLNRAVNARLQGHYAR